MSHDVIIEYEDGIEQNVEINYEEDDMSNEYNYEKENELISQGINPYNNNEINIMSMKVDDKEGNLNLDRKESPLKNILDEDKYVNNFMQNNDVNKINDDNNNKNNNNNNNGNSNPLIYIKKQNSSKNKDKENNIISKDLNKSDNNNLTKLDDNKANEINNVNNVSNINKLVNSININSNNENKNLNEIKMDKKLENNDNIIIGNDDNKNALVCNKDKNINNNNEDKTMENKVKNNIINKINLKNYRRNNKNIVQSVENVRPNIKKINDYTFNISINNSNKDIFTEIIPKNKKNIQNLKNQNIKGNNIQNLRNINSGMNAQNFRMAKKINYNDYRNNSNDINNSEDIITYRVSAISKKELQHISKTNNDIKDSNLDNNLTSYELENYNRVKRIMNGTPSLNLNLSKNNNSIENNNKVDNIFQKNKVNMDKNINLKGRQNYNFISIVNITNNSPIKNEEKLEEKDKKMNKDNKDNNYIDLDNYDEHKIYTKKIRGNFMSKKKLNEKSINKKENDVKDKKNNENEITTNTNENNYNNNEDIQIKGGENTGMNLYKSKNNNYNIINKEKIKISKSFNKIDLSQYLNNTKKNNDNINKNDIRQNRININDKDSIYLNNYDMNESGENGAKNSFLIKYTTNRNNSNKILNEKNENRLSTNNRNKNMKDFFHNPNSTILKITKTREVNINDIKLTKLSLLNKRNFSKTLSSKNTEKGKSKLRNEGKNVKTPLILKKLIEDSKKLKNKNFSSSFSFKSEKDKKNSGIYKKYL